MHKLLPRLLIALALGAGVVLVATKLRSRSAQGVAPVSLRSARDINRLLAEHVSSSSVRMHERFELENVPEHVARQLFVMDNDNFVYDPASYYRFRAHIDETFRWDEHPQGEWHRRTNAAGWREDDETTFGQRDFEILVSGDSHTDGACNNAESFVNRLETLAAAREPGRTVLAANTGVVGHSFYNYLGVLKSYESVRPDVFVVTVYGGNDFLEALRPQHYFRGTTLPPRRLGYWSRIEAAKRVSTTALAQGLNQVLYFQEYPDQIDVALDAALVTAREIRRVCAQAGIRLLYVYIPPAFEASWPELDALTQRAQTEVELSRTDLDLAARLATRFLDGLEELEIDCIDSGPIFRAQATPCYWKRDLHINLLGHDLIARALDEALASGRGTLAPHAAASVPDGPYTEAFGDGAIALTGTYQDGRRVGLWTRHYPDGTEQSRGEYSAGLRSGEWRFLYPDGTVKKRGAFVDDRHHGPWGEWFADGVQRVQASWENGQPHGLWRQWHPTGQLASETHYERGLEHGAWKAWYPNGERDVEAHYDDGVLHGDFFKGRQDGSALREGRYEDGQQAGTWKTYWPGGRIKSEGAYSAAARNGTWTFWDAAGAVDPELTGLYRDGVRVGD